MMKIIFECETEIGKCDYEPVGSHGLRYAEPDLSTVYAHTQASLNGEKGMLKIEQHCFLRHGEDLPDQPWVRPEIVLEPALESKHAMVDLAKAMHENFVTRVRKQIPEQYLV
jgi:hypothetical protein